VYEEHSRGPFKRERRAITLVVIALVVVAAASLAYLYPSLSSKTAPASPLVTPLPMTKPGDFVAYDFVTPSLGWALEVSTSVSALPGQYWVSRTTDGAKHWQTQLHGGIKANGGLTFSIQFFDNTHGVIAVGFPIELMHTANAGLSWDKVTTPEAQAISVLFSDRQHGWLLANTDASSYRAAHLYATRDSGDSWQQMPDPPSESIAMAFRSPLEGWMWSVGQDQSHLYVSRDAGNTWQSSNIPEPPGRQRGQTVMVNTVRVLPGAGVVATFAFTEGHGPLYPLFEFTSFDYGTSWKNVLQSPNQVFFGLESFEDASHWWRIDSGTLYKSPDAGQTWNAVSSNLENGSFWVYQPHVLNSKHAWARISIGERSGLTMTSDGGLHWTRQNVPQPA
jgi:photosystem II stability/assembly factor-like uncharacterized protein